MKKQVLRHFIIMTILMVCVGSGACGTKSIHFPESGPLLVYKRQASYGLMYEIYKEVYTIQADGRCLATAEVDQPLDQQILPILTIQFDRSSIEELKSQIVAAKFMSLPTDVSVLSTDEVYYSISVTDTTHTHSVSGINPDNKSFLALRSYLQKTLLADVRKQLQDAMKEYYAAFYP